MINNETNANESQETNNAGNQNQENNGKQADANADTGKGNDNAGGQDNNSAGNETKPNDKSDGNVQAQKTEGLFDSKKSDAKSAQQGAEVKYDLKFAENVPLDETAKNKFIEIAKTAKIKPEDAQKIVDLQSEVNAQYVAAAEAEHKKTIDGWKDSAKAKYGADFEKKLAAGKKALETYFSPDAVKVLGDEGTGIGNHPEIVDALVKIGETLSEDKSIHGKPASSPTSIEDLWFPGMNEKFK